MVTTSIYGLEITDPVASTTKTFEVYRSGDGQARGVNIAPKEWEIGDPVAYWKMPLYPFDGGLREDRLPQSAVIGTEYNRARTYAKANIDASNEGLLVPPPQTSTLSFPNGAISTKQKSFDQKQFHLCGRYMITVDSSGTVAVDKDFGSGKEALDMEVFNNELIVAMGESEKIWKRDSSDTWTQASDNTYAIALGVVGNKLWRAETTNKLSNCITTPLTLTSWTPASPNQYSAGDSTYSVLRIIEYGGVPAIIKPDGVYFPDPKSEFYNQAPQMEQWPHTNNGKGAFLAQGYLWVPTVIGLLRITFGESLILGPEKTNRPDFRFWTRGGVEWGESIYLLVTDEIGASQSFVCKVMKNEHGYSDHPYIWHEWCRLGSVDKGYSIGVNTWPSSGITSVTKDAGTIADLAGVGTITWGTPSNAASSNNSYATAAAGTSHYLRFSNFGFALPTDAVILGYIATLERKTSTGSSNSTKTPTNAINQAGVGTKTWTFSGSPAITGTTVGTNGSTVSTVYLVWTNFGFALPSDASIQGIEAVIQTTATDTGQDGQINDNVVKLYRASLPVGTNKASATSRATIGSAVSITYGSSTDTWGLTDLTASTLNDTAFGLAFSLTFTLCGWTIVTGTVTLKVYYTTSGTTDNVVKIVNASATVVGDNKAATTTSWPTSDTDKTYGGTYDQWGTTLLYSDVNDTDFGFVLSVTNSGGITASVDYGSLTVIYTTSDEVNTPPVLFVGHGTGCQLITLGFGTGREIDDPSYAFGSAMEVESGLFQPAQDVSLISGIIGVSLVTNVRDDDSITLQYAKAMDTSYSNLLTTQEGGGTAAITGDGTYQQFTRYAPPNTTAPYFKIKLSATLGPASGTDRCEIRAFWAFGYIRPKVTDLIQIPVYCDRMELVNGIPQGRTGGETLRLFRAWKRDQTVLTFRLPDYELGRTVRARVYDVQAREAISELDADGQIREVMIATVTLIRDDFAGAYANAI